MQSSYSEPSDLFRLFQDTTFLPVALEKERCLEIEGGKSLSVVCVSTLWEVRREILNHGGFLHALYEHFPAVRVLRFEPLWSIKRGSV